VKNQQEAQYNDQFSPGEGVEDNQTSAADEHDEYFEEAKKLVIEEQTASASLIQRRFRTGYNRALRIIEELEQAGVVGPSVGTKPREVLIDLAENGVEIND
jgi:S-DNA-T family DNA segregation ATPase FtsK/SpoIIIE